MTVASRVAIVLSFLSPALSQPAVAEIIYQTGFDAPEFTVGPLDRQGSWFALENGATVGIQDSICDPSLGQAAQIELAADSFAEGRATYFLLRPVAYRLVTASAEIRLPVGWTGSGADPHTGSIQLGMAYNDPGDIHWFTLQAFDEESLQGWRIVADTQVLVRKQTLPTNQWLHLDLDLDYYTGQGVAFVDNVEVARFALAEITSLSDLYINRISLAHAGSAPASTSVYFDSLEIQAAAPEPGAHTLTTFAIACLWSLHRRGPSGIRP